MPVIILDVLDQLEDLAVLGQSSVAAASPGSLSASYSSLIQVPDWCLQARAGANSALGINNKVLFSLINVLHPRQFQ